MKQEDSVGESGVIPQILNKDIKILDDGESIDSQNRLPTEMQKLNKKTRYEDEQNDKDRMKTQMVRHNPLKYGESQKSITNQTAAINRKSSTVTFTNELADYKSQVETMFRKDNKNLD